MSLRHQIVSNEPTKPVSTKKANPEPMLTRRKREPANFVYAISDGEYVKFGVSNNPERRLDLLQIGNAKSLRILGHIALKPDHNEGNAVERGIHTHCISGHSSGEWFRSTDTSVQEILLAMQAADPLAAILAIIPQQYRRLPMTVCPDCGRPMKRTKLDRLAYMAELMRTRRAKKRKEKAK